MATTTINIDTGGTFTDGFVVRDGVGHAVKVLTTPHDLAVCFREVIAAAADAVGLGVPELLRETAAVRYATTVGTNAVIQRRGPRLGLLTDADIPSDDGAAWGVGLFTSSDMVTRVQASDLDDGGEQLIGPMRRLLDRGARGLVAALDPAVHGPTGERHVRTIFEERHPLQRLDTVPLLLASEVTADTADARRTATALFNAYVHPDVADYLYRAEDHLRSNGYRKPLLIVHNDGGAARVAKTVAGKTYNSGPMAGLLGAAAIARAHGIDPLISVDMGGTSLDVAIIRGGEVDMVEHGRVEDVEVAFPLPDLVPIGAGGGSIAWLDGDTLRVGPDSAGAAPGPACFGFGGEAPTVTDADVVAGVLRPDAFMGGRMRLDVEAARRAMSRIAEPMGCSVEEAAVAVRATLHRDVGHRLAEELRDRGIDPATATILAFGGNGATHGAEIAAATGVPTVLTTPLAPVFSAFGTSTADVRHDYEARSSDDTEELLRTRASRDMRGEGFGDDEVTFTTSSVDRDGTARLVVGATAALPRADLDRLALTTSGPSTSEASTEVRWTEQPAIATEVQAASGLSSGDHVAGPALVDAGATTCAVPPGWTLEVGDQAVQWLHHRSEGVA